MQEGVDEMRKILIIMMLVVLALAGCKTKYVLVPEYHKEYVNKMDSVLKHDSIYVRDSVFVKQKGDTVFLSKVSYRDVYRNIYKVKCDSIIKRDSIPYPVVRELTKNERRLISIGKYSIVVIVTLVVILVIYWYRNKRC